MAMRDRLSELDTISEREPRERPAPVTTAESGGDLLKTQAAPETPSGAGGSEAPPSGAGDESPNRQFPVPPVPPPPSPGPIFGLAGSGSGGATSFARPGTAAAKPFRSPIFTANRSTAAPEAGVRFGSGTAVAAGGGSSPSFLPAGLTADAGGPSQGTPDDELQRIMAALRGGGGARF